MPRPRKSNSVTLKNKVLTLTPLKGRGKKNGLHPARKNSRKNDDGELQLSLADVALWHFYPDTGEIVWGVNACKFFGVTRNEQLKNTLTGLISSFVEEDQAPFRDSFQSGLTTRKTFRCEARVRHPNCAMVWLEFSLTSQPEKTSITKYVGTVRDVTENKNTEVELCDWKTRHDLVSESAGLLIYDYDIVNGDIVWSGNAKQVVGFTSDEMGTIGLWEDLVHPEDRDQAFRLLEISKETLKPYDVFYRFRRNDGSYAHMHDRGLFVSDSKGEAVRMLGMMSDVSDRLAAIKTIEQSERSYRQLFNSVGEAIHIQRVDGTFLDVNDTACSMYGYSKEELIGQTPEFLSAFGKNNSDILNKLKDEALLGRTQSLTWWAKKKSDEVFPVEVRLTRGNYFGNTVVIATIRDISEEMAAKQTLQESERRFRMMIEDLHVGVLLQGQDGEVQIVNRAALSLLGISEAELVEHGLDNSKWRFVSEAHQLISHDELPWIVAQKIHTPVRGKMIGLQLQGQGNTVWLLVNAEPTLLHSGELLHVIVTFTDMTERQRIEEEIKESELRFRTLQEASFGGIGLHNKGYIVDCNQGLCDITGFNYEELIGSNGLDLIAPEYREMVMQKILSRDETPYDVEGLRKDGSRYHLEIHGKNIPYREGLIRVTEFRDITERKAAEAKIVEQNSRLVAITESLKQKNEQLQEFTQIVSHNLRSPVGNILSLLNFIENAENEEERAEYIGLLKEAGSSTLNTLQELNEVLQIKQNKNIEKQRLEFEHVFSNVRRMLSAKIAESEAEIMCNFERAPSIEYPHIYLESILLNLVSNALKYAAPERKPVIRITTYASEGSVTLVVADNGSGINMQRYGHQIFKLRKTFHKHPESRGIGLFMIKSQIEAMGGTISVESAENEGSSFRVEFNKVM